MGVEEGLWFKEIFANGVIYSYKVEKIYYSGKSKFQKIDLVELSVFGKTLFLDEKIQSAQIDEYIYHEALVQPAMFSHPAPEKVLILGGGEGATLREILKHKDVKKVTMVDIDGELVEFCKKYLPEWHKGAFSDQRTELIIGDAKEFVENTKEKFDVIISDLTEPLEEGPSVYLFTKEYYGRIFEILNEKGVFVVQSGSALEGYAQFMASMNKTLLDVFEIVVPYWSFVFSFSMPWGFNIAYKGIDDKNAWENVKSNYSKKSDMELEYFSPELFEGLKLLPKKLKEELKEGKISTNKDPFIWTL